jgi:hypothetical protein
VLRNPRNGFYYAGPDRWVGSPGEAQDFQDADHAAEFARQAKRGELQVFLHYGGGTTIYTAAGDRTGDRRN